MKLDSTFDRIAGRGLTLIAALALSACASMAPVYQRPATPVPTAFPGAPAAASTQAPSTLGWRRFVLDDKQRQVVELALANNRDLRKAVANVESARALYRVQRAAQVPTINGSVGSSRSRSLASTTDNATAISSSSSATIGVSAFVIDLFGKVRSLSDAALESYLSKQETARATQVAVIGETLAAYVTLGEDNARLGTARQTQASASRSMELTQKRLAAGVASRVDVYQAETVYQQARADVASYATSVAQDRNALELLTGTPLSDALLPSTLTAPGAWYASLPVDLPSSVLLERPDIMAAEHDLKSANADIGAARAAFFPSISLTADAGVGSTALSSLFRSGATVWSFVPSVSVPIFDGGANRANLDYAKSQREVYLTTYEKTVQSAFKEVADALARRSTLDEQLSAQQALVDAASNAYDLAEARYQRGADTFLNALDAQRTLYSAQQSLVALKSTALQNSITLYQTLGGGTVSE